MAKEYIDREAAVNAVLGITIASPIVAQYADAALFSINKIPAADVKPVVRGEWKPHYEEMDAYDGGIDKVQYGYECSLCGRWEESKEAFCNCGAKMEGEE